MLLGLLFAPFGLIIPAIIRFLIVKKPLSKIAAIIITFLNLIAIITVGILILQSAGMGKSSSAVSIGGAISALLAFKMMTTNSEESVQNINKIQNK